MEILLPLAFASLALLGPYLYGRLFYKRFRQYTFLPQVPTSLSLGRPDLMFVDLRPFGPPMVIVRSHEMPSVYGHMVHVTGRTSILATHGEDWKVLRRRFNPGFAHQHLITFLPCILEKSFAFLENLDHFSQTGGAFSLTQLAGNLTFDIICSVVMDVDFGAQNMSKQSDFMHVYHELFETYASEQVDLPWFFTPRTEWKRRRLAKRVRSTLATIIRNTFDNRQTETTKSRSTLSLSLQGDVDGLTPQAAMTQTSILLSWMFYELSRTPHALKALCHELNDLFGTDSNPSTVRNKLLSDGGKDLLNNMRYTNAVIKETLRLWPPAGTARTTEPGAGLSVHTPSGEYLLEGVSIYNCAMMIQRDPEVYGDTANYFVPERWLNETAERIPAAAWRAFERGPRNCMRQELANLEARIVVALVTRRYDFSKVGTGEVSLDEAGKPIMDSKGYFKVASDMYPVTPKPIDGMMMRVKII
ncbi:cytochrome P450 52A11 [Annulohypoxylon moriforme]|nr:cytochrome P450 52A11 [Annulohypoxylon moriforme]